MRSQIYGALCGPLFVILLTPVWWNMGFLPPLAPALSPADVAQFYEDHRGAIRFGATMIMQLAILGIPWSAAISSQIRRIESPDAHFLAFAQLALGTLSFLLFVIPPVFWTVAAYRPERSADLIYLLNDCGWLALVMPVLSAVIQAGVIGYAIISDRRAVPVYPRWAAYFNFWAGLTFLPGSLATFFHSGPFAWNGIFDFWIPLATFSLWIIVMGALTARAAKAAAGEADRRS